MRELEEIDSRDRGDGTSHGTRLKQVPAETGRMLAILAASAPPGLCVEIGTSGGYSGLWLAMACRQSGRRMVTFEILPGKVSLAAETFGRAGVTDVVELVAGNAFDHLPGIGEIGFCFLDAEKEDYPGYYAMVVPKLVPGGILTADNVISHAGVLGDFTRTALDDPALDSTVVPVGSGVLLCRKRETA